MPPSPLNFSWFLAADYGTRPGRPQIEACVRPLYQRASTQRLNTGPSISASATPSRRCKMHILPIHLPNASDRKSRLDDPLFPLPTPMQLWHSAHSRGHNSIGSRGEAFPEIACCVILIATKYPFSYIILRKHIGLCNRKRTPMLACATWEEPCLKGSKWFAFFLIFLRTLPIMASGRITLHIALHGLASSICWPGCLV